METVVTFSKTVQILFTGQDQQQEYILCKVDIKKLNWKLRKLQKEGMFVIWIYFDDLKMPAQTEAKPLTGREGEKVVTNGSEIQST